MRIRNLMGRPLEGTGASEKENRLGGPSQTSPAFLEELHKAQNCQGKSRIETLLKQIGELGLKLAQQRTIANLQRYKEAIKQFLGEMINGTYQVKEETRWDRRGRRKVFVIVDKVDLYLEELTQMVMEGQADPLTIMAKVDQIKGLLLDLYT